MKRVILPAAVLLAAPPVFAEQVDLDLQLSPATPSVNTVTLGIGVDLGLASDSDTDTSTVSGNALAGLDIDFLADGSVDAIHSISFAGGTVAFDDDLSFGLSFLFGAATVDATGTDLAGQLQTPGPASPVNGSGDFDLAFHQINVNQGDLVATGTGLADAIDTTLDFDTAPLPATLVGTANLAVTLDSVVGGTATYTATLTAPISFNEPFDANGITVDVSASGNLLATDSFTRQLTEPGDANGDGFVGVEDLDLLLAHWGDTVAPGTQGDLSGNGVIDSADLDLVTGNFGNGTPPAGVVPEPGSLVLLGLGGLALISRRRR